MTDTIIRTAWTDMQEVKDKVEDMSRDGVLRFYGETPNTAALQIRVICGLGANGTGKKRQMIATASLTAAGIRALMDAMQPELARLESQEATKPNGPAMDLLAALIELVDLASGQSEALILAHGKDPAGIPQDRRITAARTAIAKARRA